jgi:hypothetical protein
MKGKSKLMLCNSTQYYSERNRGWMRESIIIQVFTSLVHCSCPSVFTIDDIYNEDTEEADKT